jgi:hypothetical protein
MVFFPQGKMQSLFCSDFNPEVQLLQLKARQSTGLWKMDTQVHKIVVAPFPQRYKSLK